MYYYKVFGLNIVSPFIIEQLIEVEECHPDVLITLDDSSVDIKEFISKGQHFGSCKGGFWFVNKYGIYSITNARRINIESTKNSKISDIIPFILGYGLTLIATQRGWLVIHGSALTYANNGMIISGESGAGKSSISSRCLSNNYKLLSDDLVVVDFKDTIKILPGYPRQNLDIKMIKKNKLQKQIVGVADRKRNKYVVNREMCFCNEEITLDKWFFIAKKDTNEIIKTTIHKDESLERIKRALFLSHIYEIIGYPKKIVAMCAYLAQKIEQYDLIRPSRGDSTNEMYEHIHRLLQV